MGAPYLGRSLRWFKKGDGYYLDKSSYLDQEKPHDGTDKGATLYSSTFVTSEAMKRRRWDLLGYASGTQHTLWETEFFELPG